jgi:glycosyltransferase involved in cell wall biosynthesis
VSRVSVAIPVKDGRRYLAELLSALEREGPDEVLVVDSGSRDDSREIARAHGAEVLEIDPGEFSHGRTRNLAAERTTGELICFLTQDATPCPGWLAAYREAFALADDVGAAYGPHLARPDTSPMIARELAEFFASFATDGGPTVQRLGDPTFLSNVNACYARACWEQIRFRDVPYSEDQAFGEDVLAAGWSKVYQPAAAVLHAHDYPPLEFMRRYFDEYRGLHEATGHVEPFAVASSAGQVRRDVAADRRWMRERGVGGGELARWTARATVHHTGRKVFSALGSRAGELPAPVRGALSLEGRDDGGSGSQQPQDGASGVLPLPATTRIPKMMNAENYDVVSRIWANGPAPLLDPVAGMADRERLRLAMVIPMFARGSGGHNTLFQIFTRLEQRGHACSVWVADMHGYAREVWPAVLRDQIREYFAPYEGPVFKDFASWQGADVVMTTGWDTVHPALELPGCRARAYIVNDHEPEFFSASTEQVLSADTYGYGMHCIAASPWLRDLLIERYGASAEAFQLGVDHDVYQPRPVERRRDTVIYYARHSTPRRAVPIGLMALAELKRRRPDVRIVLFGANEQLHASFEYEHLGVLSPPQLSRLYSEAAVGLCLSLTNFSLMPKEMLACGLPCVELAGISAESIFGEDGPLELAPLDSNRLAAAMERLLEDDAEWERRSREGISYVASHTWDQATNEVEAGLRRALRDRERLAAGRAG